MKLIRSKDLDSDTDLSKRFMPHQVAWIQAEKAIHAQHKQVMALAEKFVRIGWTYADGFKNVRKRIWHKDRDYPVCDQGLSERAGVHPPVLSVRRDFQSDPIDHQPRGGAI